MQSLPNGKTIPAPTPDFNVIFQLSHILRHYIYEGIALKQFVDYFYTMKEYTSYKRNYGAKGQDELISHTLRNLGMLKFAKVMMYIMYELGIEEQNLYTEINEKGGKTVLDSIVYDDDIHTLSLHNMKDLTKYKSVKERQGLKVYRAIKLFPYFPGETLWGILPRMKGALATHHKHPQQR